MKLIVGVILCGIVLATPALGGEPLKPSIRHERPKTRDAVAAEDLLLKIKIIGLLERPLGEIVEVKGVWIASDSAKPGEIRLLVKEVDGVAVEKRVEFVRRFVEGSGLAKQAAPHVGDAWLMRAVETGGIVGLPQEAFEHPVQQEFGYCFKTRLVVLSLKPDAP